MKIFENKRSVQDDCPPCWIQMTDMMFFIAIIIYDSGFRASDLSTPCVNRFLCKVFMWAMDVGKERKYIVFITKGKTKKVQYYKVIV